MGRGQWDGGQGTDQERALWGGQAQSPEGKAGCPRHCTVFTHNDRVETDTLQEYVPRIQISLHSSAAWIILVVIYMLI